jgi:hypothetical protein
VGTGKLRRHVAKGLAVERDGGVHLDAIENQVRGWRVWECGRDSGLSLLCLRNEIAEEAQLWNVVSEVGKTAHFPK